MTLHLNKKKIIIIAENQTTNTIYTSKNNNIKSNNSKLIIINVNNIVIFPQVSSLYLIRTVNKNNAEILKINRLNKTFS